MIKWIYVCCCCCCCCCLHLNPPLTYITPPRHCLLPARLMQVLRPFWPHPVAMHRIRCDLQCSLCVQQRVRWARLFFGHFRSHSEGHTKVREPYDLKVDQCSEDPLSLLTSIASLPPSVPPPSVSHSLLFHPPLPRTAQDLYVPCRGQSC
jgi:hypothetical protein